MTRPRPAWTPPLRDGLGASRVAVPPGAARPDGTPWPDLATFLTARLRPGIDWRARLAAGGVLDAQGQPLAPDAPCVPGTVVWYWRELPPQQPEHPVPFEMPLLHLDEHLAVFDKPHFLPVTPGGLHVHETALVRARRATGIATLVPMHRLDLETAGVLAFVVRPRDRAAYVAVLRERRAHKVYEAVAPWRADLALPLDARHALHERPGDRFMQMAVHEGEPPNAHTTVQLLQRLPRGPAIGNEGAHDLGPALAHDLAHYRLTPHTGRKHQLRAQMAALGLPICGDRIYPVLQPAPAPDAPPDFSAPLQLLARELAFDDPVTGQARRFVSARLLDLTMRR